MFSDTNTPIDSNMSSHEGGMGQELRNHFKTAGQWGRIISIAGLAMSALMIIAILFAGSAFLALSSGSGGVEAGALGGMMTFFYLVVIGASCYLYYLLYSFSTNAIAAADNGDLQKATSSMSSLATMFKLIGVLMIIYIGFFLLIIVFGTLGGLITMI